MTAIVTTVGVFLTEDERRHLIRLCGELEARDGIDRHGGDNPQARQLAALRKLMGLPVDRLLADIREAFESGFSIGVERGHDTAQVRAEVTDEMVREDLAVRDRALEEHVAGLAERAFSGLPSLEDQGAKHREDRRATMIRDYYVTVCAACRCASCWHGEILCRDASASNVTDVLASELRLEHREHPSYFSIVNLREVCGNVRYAS